MRILQINKFFRIRGGSGTVFFDTITGLRKRGETVSEFSMQDPQNLSSEYSQYFVSPLSLKEDKLGALGRVFYSPEVNKNLVALLAAVKPEVAHLHDVYRELSASTFLTLKKKKIPMVLTVHDMFPLVPNHSFMYKETMAEKMYHGSPINWVLYRSVNNSFFESLGGTFENLYYRWRGIWKAIEIFICPSVFMKQKMVAYGFPEHKIRVIKNPCALPARVPALGTKVVYFGRLHVEKGIRVFMRALAEPGLEKVPVLIVGSGPEEQWVDAFIRKHNLKYIERRPWVTREEIPSVMAEAKVVVVPSVFYETGGLSAIEALSYGRLVIASNRGALPEVVKDNETGFLVPPEDSNALGEKIKEVMSLSPAEAEHLTTAGRALVKKEHDPDNYIDELLKVYEEVAG